MIASCNKMCIIYNKNTADAGFPVETLRISLDPLLNSSFENIQKRIFNESLQSCLRAMDNYRVNFLYII